MLRPKLKAIPMLAATLEQHSNDSSDGLSCGIDYQRLILLNRLDYVKSNVSILQQQPI